jgi:AAA+ superfamily predicted ATPase
LAEGLAYELMVPLFVVRYEAVVGSFSGETSGRLKRLFDFARTHHCVLFFDEFDTLVNFPRAQSRLAGQFSTRLNNRAEHRLLGRQRGCRCEPHRRG